MGKPTVSRELYRILKEDGGFVSSGHLESLHVLNATGSTITRKLRMLCEQGFIEVRYQEGTHHAEYRARVKKAEVVPLEAAQKPLKASQKPAELKMVQTVRYEMRDGLMMAVLGRIPLCAG